MLLFQVTDLEGAIKGTAFRHSGGSVDIPYNDARTAKLTLPMSDPLIRAGHGRALDRMLKVTYVPWDAQHDDDDYLVFFGVILTPIYDFDAGTVELNAHDPSIAWKKNNHRYGDYVVDVGYPVDGHGVRLLAESALPLPEQLDRGVRHPGIYWGWDSSYQQPAPPTDPANPSDGDGAWSVVQRGQQVWETITQIADQVDGPDWELEPVDDRHPRYVRDSDTGERFYVSGVADGYYCQLNTYDKVNTEESEGQRWVDRRASIAWQYGVGSQNLAQLTWTPDGNAVSNYAVVVFPGGQSRRQDTQRRALAHNEASWLQYGIYEYWESSNAKDYDKRVLQAKADAVVKAYSFPPSFVSVTCQPEGSSHAPPHCYKRDFDLGDVMTVQGQRDGTTVTMAATATKITLAADGNGTVTTSMELTPKIDGDINAPDAEVG